jgi:predicted kinase
MILHLVCGLPGAGKTTLAKQLELETGALRLCPDEWMAVLGMDLFDEAFRFLLEQQLMVMAKNVLQQGGSVIVEFGSWAASERADLRNLAQQAGAQVWLYWLDAPVAELARRVAARSGVDMVHLSQAKVQEISSQIERPTKTEAALFDRAAVKDAHAT